MAESFKVPKWADNLVVAFFFCVLLLYALWGFVSEAGFVLLGAYVTLIVTTVGFLVLFLLFPVMLIDVLAKPNLDKRLNNFFRSRTKYPFPKISKLFGVAVIYAFLSIITAVFLAPIVKIWVLPEAGPFEFWQARFYLQVIVLFVILSIRVTGKLGLRNIKNSLMGFFVGAIILSILQQLVGGVKEPLESLTAPQTHIIFVFFLLLDYLLLETRILQPLLKNRRSK